MVAARGVNWVFPRVQWKKHLYFIMDSIECKWYKGVVRVTSGSQQPKTIIGLNFTSKSISRPMIFWYPNPNTISFRLLPQSVVAPAAPLTHSPTERQQQPMVIFFQKNLNPRLLRVKWVILIRIDTIRLQYEKREKGAIFPNLLIPNGKFYESCHHHQLPIQNSWRFLRKNDRRGLKKGRMSWNKMNGARCGDKEDFPARWIPLSNPLLIYVAEFYNQIYTQGHIYP